MLNSPPYDVLAHGSLRSPTATAETITEDAVGAVSDWWANDLV